MNLISLCLFMVLAVFFLADYFLNSFERIETESKVHNAMEKKKNKSIFMPALLRWADSIGSLIMSLKIKKLNNFLDRK